MSKDAIDTINDAFGDQEAIWEAGVFALHKTKGWWIFRRQKFTQMGTATVWAKEQLADLSAQKQYQRYRISVVTSPDTLKAVQAEYEEKRKAGDPAFIDPADK
jgi:hypothetical protein